jgi:hypothetical protein
VFRENSRYTGLGINTLIRAAKRGELPLKGTETRGGNVTVKKTDLDAPRERNRAFGARGTSQEHFELPERANDPPFQAHPCTFLNHTA